MSDRCEIGRTNQQGENDGPSRFVWAVAGPEHRDMDPARLEAMQRELGARSTRALLVIRGDAIVLEWYAPDTGPTTRCGTASLAKALVGGMSLLVAMDDGRLRPDDPACEFIVSWRDHPEKSRITLRHLATYTSGLEDAEAPGKRHEELEGWKGEFWRREQDPFRISLDDAPVVFPPGTRFAYSNPGMAALTYAVTKSLQGTAHPDVRSALGALVMGPMGIAPEEWCIGYTDWGDGRPEPRHTDGMTLYANWGGASYTARATACVGRLMLHRGEWQGRQLLCADSVSEAVQQATPVDYPPYPAPGLCWWTNANGRLGSLPRDAFAGAGAGHALLLVVPSLELIVVRYGSNLDTSAGWESGERYWEAFAAHVFNPIAEALHV